MSENTLALLLVVMVGVACWAAIACSSRMKPPLTCDDGEIVD